MKKPATTTRTTTRRFAVLKKDFPYETYGGLQVIERGTEFRVGARGTHLTPAGDLLLLHWACYGAHVRVPATYLRLEEGTETVTTVTTRKPCRA